MSVDSDETKVAELVVLVNEDARGLRGQAQVLKELGFRVLGFTSPATALPTLLSRRVDLLLIADGLAGLDGATLCARARAMWGDARPACVGLVKSPAALTPEARRDYDVIVAEPVGVMDLIEALDRAVALRDAERDRATLEPSGRLRVARGR